MHLHLTWYLVIRYLFFSFALISRLTQRCSLHVFYVDIFGIEIIRISIPKQYIISWTWAAIHNIDDVRLLISVYIYIYIYMCVCVYVHTFIWHVITHPCRKFNGGLTMPLLKLRHKRIIASHKCSCVITYPSSNISKYLLIKGFTGSYLFLSSRRTNYSVLIE